MNLRSLSISALAVSLSGVVLVTGAPTASNALLVDSPSPGSSGIGDPYWPLDGNGGIDVGSYKIDNAYAFDTGRMSGRTTIALTATQDLKSFSLDFLLPTRQVTVDGKPAKTARAGGGHELQITPAKALPAGSKHTVVVTYAGKPGQQRYAGEMNWLANEREVVAMNEPHMAPWWFPSNDHPLDKARVDISITVPRGKVVVANGLLKSKKQTKAGTTWRWKAADPMATYLAFFAAGDFTVEKGKDDGLPWVNAVSKRLPARAQKDAQKESMKLLRMTPGIVADLEKDLGDYPFDSTGGLVTSLPVGFALENQTRPTYPAMGPGYLPTVVHELAHQWFGDDVAVAGWRDIWLNEGFASFMEWRYAERHGTQKAADSLKSTYASHAPDSAFWKVIIGNPGPAKVFDGAVYMRGAMTVQALRNRVGDEAFWEIIRTWLSERSGGNGSVADFQEVATRVSGQDLKSFFDAWLFTPARPAQTAANGLA